MVRHENLRRELVTESQLLCQLRQKGVSSPSEVAEALLEGGGKISVLLEKGKPTPPPPEANGHALNGVHRPAEANGHADPSSHEDPDVDDFVRAADRLREKIADHERHIAEHRAAVAELKGMLAEHGVRWKAHETRHHESPTEERANDRGTGRYALLGPGHRRRRHPDARQEPDESDHHGAGADAGRGPQADPGHGGAEGATRGVPAHRVVRPRRRRERGACSTRP